MKERKLETLRLLTRCTLNEWLSDLSSDFRDASISAVQIAVGSFNQGVDVFFDDVRISNSNTGLEFAV